MEVGDLLCFIPSPSLCTHVLLYLVYSQYRCLKIVVKSAVSFYINTTHSVIHPELHSVLWLISFSSNAFFFSIFLISKSQTNQKFHQFCTFWHYLLMSPDLFQYGMVDFTFGAPMWSVICFTIIPEITFFFSLQKPYIFEIFGLVPCSFLRKGVYEIILWEFNFLLKYFFIF